MRYDSFRNVFRVRSDRREKNHSPARHKKRQRVRVDVVRRRRAYVLSSNLTILRRTYAAAAVCVKCISSLGYAI